MKSFVRLVWQVSGSKANKYHDMTNARSNWACYIMQNNNIKTTQLGYDCASLARETSQYCHNPVHSLLFWPGAHFSANKSKIKTILFIIMRLPGYCLVATICGVTCLTLTVNNDLTREHFTFAIFWTLWTTRKMHRRGRVVTAWSFLDFITKLSTFF